MSTITKEFTKEQLIEQAKKNIEVLRGAVEKIPGSSDAAVIHLKLAEITLASLEAEAVAYMWDSDRKDVDAAGYYRPEHKIFAESSVKRYGGKVVALYTAPPAPVSVPEWTNEQCMEFLSIAFRHAEINGDLQLDDIRLGMKMVNGSCAAMLQGADGNSLVVQDCSCRTCRPVTFNDSRFVVCPECGNKRCPHANDHRNSCTGSNEPGQEGSAYPAAPQQEAK